MIINAPLVVATAFRKYGVVGVGGDAVTEPLTGCVPLICAAGIGSVAYVPCTKRHDCVPLVLAVARTLNRFSALTDASHAYIG